MSSFFSLSSLYGCLKVYKTLIFINTFYPREMHGDILYACAYVIGPTTHLVSTWTLIIELHYSSQTTSASYRTELY